MSHTYELDAGRLILKDGKPFITIGRVGDTLPTEADDMAAQVCLWLREHGQRATVSRAGLYRSE